MKPTMAPPPSMLELSTNTTSLPLSKARPHSISSASVGVCASSTVAKIVTVWPSSATADRAVGTHTASVLTAGCGKTWTLKRFSRVLSSTSIVTSTV